MKKLKLFFIFCLVIIISGCKISGEITDNGAGIEGVTVTLDGNIHLETTTDSDGNYAFSDENLNNNNYTITPSKAGYTFSPASRDVYVENLDVKHVDFNGYEYFELDDTFSLEHQKTKYNIEENITIKFEEVISDSRCPIEAKCIWEGNAEVSFTFILNDTPSTVILNTSLEPTEISLSGYSIKLLDLEPPASLANPPEAEDYTAYLIISKSDGYCKSNADCNGINKYCKKEPGDCDSIGTCVPRPNIYMTIWDPVCGCDGETYPSILDAANNGVNVDYKGQCQDSFCDDGTEVLCDMVPPSCSPYEMLAIQNNCWVCVNPVTCRPWGEPGCSVKKNDCPEGYGCNPCGTSSCPACEDCVPACTKFAQPN